MLFATDSFWEGVDVRGDALRCVVITRLPFRVPTEPIEQARVEAIAARGGNPFAERALPQAVIKLKQGFGRLIRIAHRSRLRRRARQPHRAQALRPRLPRLAAARPADRRAAKGRLQRDGTLLSRPHRRHSSSVGARAARRRSWLYASRPPGGYGSPTGDPYRDAVESRPSSCTQFSGQNGDHLVVVVLLRGREVRFPARAAVEVDQLRPYRKAQRQRCDRRAGAACALTRMASESDLTFSLRTPWRESVVSL